jgi:hypothetical protein
VIREIIIVDRVILVIMIVVDIVITDTLIQDKEVARGERMHSSSKYFKRRGMKD